MVLVQLCLHQRYFLTAADTLVSEMHANVRFQLASKIVNRAPIAILDRSSRNQYAIIHRPISVLCLNIGLTPCKLTSIFCVCTSEPLV